MRRTLMCAMMVLAGVAVSMPAVAQPDAGELLHKDVRRGSVTDLLERERRLRTQIRVGADAGWLRRDDADSTSADVQALDDDVRRLAMGNVNYTPQSDFDALYDRLRQMEAFVASRRPGSAAHPRRTH